jgi:pantetheine-phosphate adenylyltransferase
MGGTFDHLHAAHKLLLQAALFITETRLIVGVISPKLLASKTNAALIEPLDARLGAVNGFLSRCGLGDRIPYVIEIEDALGPTAWDPEVSAIAVSRETLAGAAEVNRVRGSKGLSLLDVLSVNVISSTLEQEGGEEVLRTVDLSEVPDDELKHSKMGSTGVRAWMAQRNQK